MKTIIAGGRDVMLDAQDFQALDKLGITMVVTGGARGVDECASKWAYLRRIPLQTFPVSDESWRVLGKRAGFMRNQAMAVVSEAEACVLFQGGSGTESMFQIAKQRRLKIYDWRQGLPGTLTPRAEGSTPSPVTKKETRVF